MEVIKLPVRKAMTSEFKLPYGTLQEIKEDEELGRVLVAFETDLNELGRRSGLIDVATQCARGEVENVVMGDVDAVRRKTGEQVALTMYFVERLAYLQSCAERRSERAKAI